VLAIALLTVALLAGVASAQVREPSIGYSVRVVVKEAPIFAQTDERSQVLGRARANDMLVVIGKENAWYKVRIPRDRKLSPSGPDSGYVPAKLVAVIGPGAAAGPAPAPGGRPAAVPARRQPGAQGWGSVELRPFGEVAFQTFTAKKSFDAIFGNSTGVFYGGGVDMKLARRVRLGVSLTHFQKTGERAFAYNGESYSMGIADTVSMTPITFNVTYRFPGKRVTPYVGGGGGAVVYRETSDFANAGDDVSKTAGAYQVVGGVEFPLGSALSLAVEGQYQGVPGILGDHGVSQAFGEQDAGGFSIRARILFGK
jgi:opacity protein-like surface antigen